MKLRLTLLTALGCLLLTSCKDPVDNNNLYATNKAGERLVEKILYTSSYDDTVFTYFTYSEDGTLASITNHNKFYDSDIKDWVVSQDKISFERKSNTLHMYSTTLYAKTTVETTTTFDLNEDGLIVIDRGWEADQNYRLTYDENNRLQNVYRDDVLKKTFTWEDGNISDVGFQYINQPQQANIDWSAYFHNTESYDEGINTPSIDMSWAFSCSGFLGEKNKDLLIVNRNQGREDIIEYQFDEEGFVSSIEKRDDFKGSYTYTITYLKR